MPFGFVSSIRHTLINVTTFIGAGPELKRVAKVILSTRKLNSCEAIRDREDQRITTMQWSRIPSRISGNATTLVVTLIINRQTSVVPQSRPRCTGSHLPGFLFGTFSFPALEKRKSTFTKEDQAIDRKTSIPINLKVGNPFLCRNQRQILNHTKADFNGFLFGYFFFGRTKKIVCFKRKIRAHQIPEGLENEDVGRILRYQAPPGYSCAPTPP